MNQQPIKTMPSTGMQIQRIISGLLGCQPHRTHRGLEWERAQGELGIRSALLLPRNDGLQEIEVSLASVTETNGCSIQGIWDSMAKLIEQTEQVVLPIPPMQADRGLWRIMARIRLRDTAMTLPRVERLEKAFEALDRFAMALQAELPATSRAMLAKLPAGLEKLVDIGESRMKQDSREGAIVEKILTHLDSGLTVALVGNASRVRLEIDRLARVRSNIAMLQQPVPLQKLPQLARDIQKAGFVLAVHCMLLRPSTSVYEQGRELDAALLQLESTATPVLVHGSEAEQEATFGIGQGRDHSPMRPLIEYLPRSENADLVRAILANRPEHLAVHKLEQIVPIVLETLKEHGAGREDLQQPLANMAVELGPSDPRLSQALSGLACDLVGRRETFGTCDEAPPKERPRSVQNDLEEKLGGDRLKDILASRILGQCEAVEEVVARIWMEVITQSPGKPLRLLLAGPVGTGKSVTAKYLAEALEWPCHYVDAASFDSSHAVATSLAGASPGIVNSYNDGVLARIARRPSVVEVADLDHAQPGVKGTLCDFFLRILEEGTMQTGSGMVIRTIPSLIFIFTSNTAFGTRKATSRFGFGVPTREEVREEVSSLAREQLGHAFISRVGDPIIYEEFGRATAIEVARREIETLVQRVTGARRVTQSAGVAEMIIRSLATYEGGARGIIDEVRAQLAEALRCHVGSERQQAMVRCEKQYVVIETL